MHPLDGGLRPPRVKGFQADIRLKTDAIPKILQPYPLSQYDQLRLDLHEDQEVADGKARWSLPGETTQWGAPSFVVDSEGKGLLGRPVRDYRWFNTQSLDVAWPSPHGESCLAQAQRATILSFADCIWGFTQVEITPESQNYLALMTRRGILFPLVMYFGAKQGPGMFQKLMDTTFGELRDKNNDKFHSIFIDDVTVATEKLTENESYDVTFERHVEQCELFFGKAKEKGIQFKMTM